MRLNSLKAIVKTALRGAAVLLLGAGVASAQQTINLAAGPTPSRSPDGSVVPMWGYSLRRPRRDCSTATCARLNPAATGWSPVVITVPGRRARPALPSTSPTISSLAPTVSRLRSPSWASLAAVWAQRRPARRARITPMRNRSRGRFRTLLPRAHLRTRAIACSRSPLKLRQEQRRR